MDTLNTAETEVKPLPQGQSEQKDDCAAGSSRNMELGSTEKNVEKLSTSTVEIVQDQVSEAEKSRNLRLRAMANNLVMAKIAAKLPAGDLLNLRQVCIQWKDNFLPHLMKKHRPILLTGSEYIWRGHTLCRILGLTQVLQFSPEIPFTRFFFKPNEIDTFFSHDPQEEMNCLQDFITQFGNTITELTMIWNGDTSLSVTDLRKIVFQLTPELVELKLEVTKVHVGTQRSEESEDSSSQLINMLPKLKRIILDTSLDSNNLITPGFIQFMTDVINSATGLEHMELYDFSPNNCVLSPTLNTLLQASALESSRFRSLELSTLLLPDWRILIQSVKRKENPLRLESFLTFVEFIKNGNGTNNDNLDQALQFLQDFLRTQAPTLKKLTLDFEPEYDTNVIVNWGSFCIPRMEQLKKLSIVGTGLTREELQFEGNPDSMGSFMDTFPMLTTFSYNNNDSWNEMDLFHYGVTELELSLGTKDNDYAGFYRFGSDFPSLTRLELDMTVFLEWSPEPDHVMGAYSKIWNTWPTLTAIHLTGDINGAGVNLDSLLSGVPKADLCKMRLELHSMDPTTITLASLREMVDKCKTRPAMSDLKHLQELTIIDDEYKPKLTGNGGYFGLALASLSLQRVVIHGREMNLVSEQCLTFIRSVFGPCAVIDV